MYYNTTKLTGGELMRAYDSAKNKNEKIAAICKTFERPFTPDEVQAAFEKLSGRRQSLNTVRRCITDLTKEGILIKTSQMGISDMGKPMHKWKRA